MTHPAGLATLGEIAKDVSPASPLFTLVVKGNPNQAHLAAKSEGEDAPYPAGSLLLYTPDNPEVA